MKTLFILLVVSLAWACCGCFDAGGVRRENPPPSINERMPHGKLPAAEGRRPTE